MKFILYAGSLRPGGGLTVAKLVAEALAQNPESRIVVYTGASDASDALAGFFEAYENVTEVRFYPNVSSMVRYLLSKVYFIPKSLLDRSGLLISINYFIPSFYRLMVYHLNLLSFIRSYRMPMGLRLKQFDVGLACRFGDLNIFESDYLRAEAENAGRQNISGAGRLYIAVDPAFYVGHPGKTQCENADLLLVSSRQPHKDNQTTLRALKSLVDQRPEVPWKLTIVGGQSVDQWDELMEEAKALDIASRVSVLGPVDKQALATLMSESLCLVNSSRIESFCMVALESMAAGCPAIVTNETSMPESVGDAAVIVEAGQPDQFADAVLNLFDDPGHRSLLVKKGLVRAEGFTLDAFRKNLDAICEGVRF